MIFVSCHKEKDKNHSSNNHHNNNDDDDVVDDDDDEDEKKKMVDEEDEEAKDHDEDDEEGAWVEAEALQTRILGPTDHMSCTDLTDDDLKNPTSVCPQFATWLAGSGIQILPPELSVAARLMKCLSALLLLCATGSYFRTVQVKPSRKRIETAVLRICSMFDSE